MKNDLISIIVPIYNVEKYLIRCIESIINQTYKTIEIILVDDGSTDNSSKICDEYKNKDKRIKVIHKKNGGLSSARNVGLDIAKGKYIGFVDSDDYISPNMYEMMYNNLIKTSGDIIICNFSYFKKEPPSFTTEFNLKEYTNIEAILELIKLKKRKIEDYAWNKLYKKELFKNIRYPERFLYEDIGTTYKLFNKSKKIVTIDCRLYAYYDNGNSITYNNNTQKIFDRIEMIENRYNDLIKNYKEYKDLIETNRIITLLAAVMWSSHFKNKKIFYSEKLKNTFKIIENVDKKLIESDLVPKKYKIEYRLFCFNKEIFRIFNIIYYHFKKIYKKTKKH